MRPDDERSAARSYGQGYQYFAMALTFAAAILVFGAGGWALDGVLHTRPLFAILGALLGGFAGFMRMYYRVRADMAQREERRGEPRPPESDPR